MQKIIFILIFLSAVSVMKAQEPALAKDQNPNYKITQAKYQNAQENTLEAMNTTAQQTYKAYDWTEAKQERKKQRIEFRQQRALAFWSNGYNYLDCFYLFNRPPYYYRH
jgi:hypothetical protein